MNKCAEYGVDGRALIQWMQKSAAWGDGLAAAGQQNMQEASQQFAPARNFAGRLWNGAKRVGRGVASTAKGVGNAALGAGQQALGWGLNQAERGVNAAGNAARAVGGAVQRGAQAVGNAAQEFGQDVGDAMSSGWNNYQNTMRGIGEAAGRGVTGAIGKWQNNRMAERGANRVGRTAAEAARQRTLQATRIR